MSASSASSVLDYSDIILAYRCAGCAKIVDERCQRLVERWPGDASISDNGGDLALRCDIKGRVGDMRALRRDAHAANMGNFVGRAFLNHDLFARRQRKIDGGARRDYIKRNAMLAGQNCQAIGADLVGDIAVGGDAISAHEDGVDARLAHEMRRHVVGNQREWDVFLLQLPGGEPRALQDGPGFIDEDLHALALRVRDGNWR